MTDGHGVTFTDTTAGNQPDSQGLKFTPNKSITLAVITKGATSNATRVRIWEASANTYGTLLATAFFSGDSVALDTPLVLTSGTKYIIEVDKSGSNFVDCYATATYPISRTDFTFNSGSQIGADQSGYVINILTLTYALVSPLPTHFNSSGGGYASP